MFSQGQFLNDANATPESIARKRALIAALMPRFGSAKYVGEGLGQLATGVMIGRQNKKLDGAEAAGRQSADELFGSLLGSGGSAEPGGFTVMGQPGVGDGGMPMVPPDPNSPHALGADTMAALGKPPIPTGNDAASIKAGLVARGLPDHVADGFVMNMMDESGLNPGINETNPTVPGSRGGFGLYQLTGPRRRAYEAYAAEKGVPLDNVDAQLDFLMMEMQGPEASAASAIMSTKTPGEAGAAIVNEFLRPAEEHRASRSAEYLGGAPQGAPAPAGYNAATPSIPTPDLLAALSNPWLAPEQKAVLQSIYEQQVQAGDPMRQLELQKAQLELAQLQNPTDAPPEDFTARMFTLNALGIDPQSDEGKAYVLTGKLPEPPEPGFAPMSAEEVQGLGLPPGSYQRGPNGEIKQIGGSGTNVTVNNGSGEVGTIPQGYELFTDPATGARSMRPIPGGPEDSAKADAAKASGAAIASDVVTTAADRALAANSERLVGGLPGAIAAYNPSSANAEVYRQVDVLTANAKVENLQAMRNESPTGGALGSVTEKETQMLADQAGALNPASPNFERDLKDYTRNLLRIIHGDEAGTAIFNEKYGDQPTPDADGWTTLPNGVKVRVKQ